MRKLFPLSVLMLTVMVIGLTTPVQAQTITVSAHLISSQATVNDYEPEPAQVWAVTDGLALFSFYATTVGDLVYQSGYDFPPAPYNQPKVTFLNHTQIGLTAANLAYGFTLTQGYTIQNAQNQSLFVFDAVWQSDTNRLSLVELTDPLVNNNAGNHYFTPSTVADNTVTASVNTEGIPVELSAVNLPNGDVIVGDSEAFTNGTWTANAYMFFHESKAFSKIAGFANPSQPFFSVKPEYVGGVVYYVTGMNRFTDLVSGPHVSLYQALGPNYNSPTLITSSLPEANKFMVSSDKSNLYVAGENSMAFWVTTVTNGVLGTQFTIDEATLGPLDYAVTRDIFMSTHVDNKGVHFYYDYRNNANGKMFLGLALSHDGLNWYQNDTILDFGTTFASIASAPQLTGASRTPKNYNPEIDYLLAIQKDPSLANYVVEAVSIQIPSILTIITAGTSTFVQTTFQTSTTMVTSANLSTQSDFITPFLMLLIVALPSGAFGIIGGLLGGGKGGVVMLILGAIIGLGAGIVFGWYPSWSVIFVAVGIVAALVSGTHGSSGP